MGESAGERLGEMSPTTFIGHHGCLLDGLVASPKDRKVPRYVVVIVHGMAEHAARYGPTAARFVAHGAAAFCYNHRGHGPVGLKAGSLGFVAYPDGYSLLVRDLFCVIEQARAAFPAVPCFLLGQSMGSIVIRDYLHRYADHAARLHGVVLTGTVGHPGLQGCIGLLYAALMCRKRGASSAAPDLDRLTFGAYGKRFQPLRTRFDWLSRDPAEVDAYVQDPLCGFVCATGFYLDLVRATLRVNSGRAARRSPRKLPVIALSGNSDPVGRFGRGPTGAVRRYQRNGGSRWRLRLYREARHELFHETNADQVRDDVCEWIDGILCTDADTAAQTGKP